MGKKIKVQRRGRGGSTFRSKTTHKIAPLKYPARREESISGVVKGLYHEPGRDAPLLYVALDGGAGYYTAAPEGVYIDQPISLGLDAPLKVGNVRPLGTLPEGTMVCNV